MGFGVEAFNIDWRVRGRHLYTKIGYIELTDRKQAFIRIQGFVFTR